MTTRYRGRIALVHDSLNSYGGAERVALEIARALKELGFSIDLYVIERTDWERVKRLTSYGPDVIDREHVIPLPRLPPLIYRNYIVWLVRDVISTNIIKKKYDVVITTKQSAVPVLSDVIYMHFPDFIPHLRYLYYPHVYSRILPRVYLKPAYLFSNALIALFRFMTYNPLVLTNSRFSAAVIKRFLGVKPVVLYPPVEVERYLPFAESKRRKDIVLTISRIELSKGLELIPEIAMSARRAKFVVVGALASPDYLRSLRLRIRALNLQDRVMVVPDLSEGLKLELMKKAKVYLHPMRYEHFGIAVVEAMAARLVPVVHKSGGPWTDIVEMGRYGRGFSDAQEAAGAIEELLSLDESKLDELRVRAVSKAKTFDFKHFKNSLYTVIDHFLRQINEGLNS